MITKENVLKVITLKRDSFFGHLDSLFSNTSKDYFGIMDNNKIIIWPNLKKFNLFYPLFVLLFDDQEQFIKIQKKPNPFLKLFSFLFFFFLISIVTHRFINVPTEVAISSSLVLLLLFLVVFVIMKQVYYKNGQKENVKLYDYLIKLESFSSSSQGKKIKSELIFKSSKVLQLSVRLLTYPFAIGIILMVLFLIPISEMKIKFLILIIIPSVYLISDIIIIIKKE
jgi:hypothetical protein